MSTFKVANEISGVGKTEDYPDEYFDGFNKALPKSELVNKDYENIFSKGVDMSSNDSIEDIIDWFKAAKPEPTGKDKVTQLACIFEEVAELAEACGRKDLAEKLNDESDYLKKITPLHAERFFIGRNRVAILDATSDITVTVQGLNQLMGFDGIGALKEVIRSNNSKMVDGKFIFDENAKISKPNTFSEPNLKPFLGVK